MHPEDRDVVREFCVAQSVAGLDHEAEYRALTSDGTFVWIRDVVHVCRDSDGEVESLIGFMLEIPHRQEDPTGAILRTLPAARLHQTT